MQTAATVRAYIVENFLYVRPEYPLQDSEQLFSSGIIDSFGAMELIGFLEERFAIVIDDAEVTEERMGSIDAITRFVDGKLAAKGTGS
jgi:acyl carrier protein